MSATQPIFGFSAFSGSAFAPSNLNSTAWNSFLGPFPYQEPAQEVSNDPNTKYLKLFKKNKGIESQQSAVLSEDLDVLRIAPLFSGSVHAAANQSFTFGKQPLSQYGVLGMISDNNDFNPARRAQEKLLFSNVEEPWSAFICGSQGSGKSHTLSCLLENNLLPDSSIGNLKTPLTGLVFHYDKFANLGNGQACEAAYLCSAANGGVPVQVLVAPTSLKRMVKQYHNLPGLPKGCRTPKVLPLYFSQEQLSVDTMMTLMAVNNDEATAPLYISAIRQLLRDIAMDNQDSPGFNYHDFRHRLACLALTEGQNGPLTLRLQLLQSFLLEQEQTVASRAAFAETWTFKPGTLTIIDLSDQFVNETDACALFSICLKLFMADWKSNPRIIALDEAHKFLTASVEATKLTSDLIAVIRQQRHMSARVIVATQEPTISETLLDLCNVSIIHRFNSPKWFRTLQQHLAGACVDKEERDAMFRNIVKLSVGEALLFCPTAVLDMESGRPVSLQDGVVKILVRDRVSVDGGQSVQASSRDHVDRCDPLPAMPEYQRFKGDKMPAPGSLARKTFAKPREDLPNNENAPESTRVLRSMNNSQNAPANHGPPAAAAKRQRTTYDGAFSSETATSETNESASTDQDSASDHQSSAGVVHRLEQVTLAPPSRNTRAQAASQVVISKKHFPAGHKYKATGVSEGELRRLMRQVVDNALTNKKVIKDPSDYLSTWLSDTSRHCGLDSFFLEGRDLPTNGKAIDLLRLVVKQHYDARGISQKNRVAQWLKG